MLKLESVDRSAPIAGWLLRDDDLRVPPSLRSVKTCKITIYSVLLFSSFTFPTLFAEDFVGLLGEISADLAPLDRLARLDLAKLEL